MKISHNQTDFNQNKSIRRNNSRFNTTNYKKNNKMQTQESVANQQPFLTTNSITKDYINFYPNILNQVSKSQVFISNIPHPKDHYAEERHMNASNKYILGNSNNKEGVKNQREYINGTLAKRSVQILIGLNQGMIKAEYSKISRRKQQVIKKNTIKSYQGVQHSPQIIENVPSQEKLIEKYRELLYQKDKPFNMINKLYQIDLFTTKEATIRPKQIYKPTSVKLNITKKAGNLQDKINHFSQKYKSNNKVKDMLLCGSQKFIGKQAQHNSTLTSFNPNRKPNSQERCKQVRQIRQFRNKNMKVIEQPQNYRKLDSPLKGNQLKINQNVQKKSDLISLDSPSKIQKPIIFPLPKKISSAAFIIYEVFQDRNKAYSKKFQFYQTTKKRQITGKIHASFNIKSASEIASLTKIMTCIVIIQICQKLSINPHQQKYKTAVFQSVIKGTTADIQVGQIYTINQLLHGLMLPSGNDASLALARWGGNVLLVTDNDGQKRRTQQKGQKTLLNEYWLVNNKYLRFKEDKLKYKRCYNRFIAEMNKRARILGLQRTTYVNSHGLSNPHNKSCCLDLAILCQYAMQNVYFRSIVSCKQYQGSIEKCIQTTDNPRKMKGKPVKAKISEDPQQMNLLEDAEDEAQFNKSDEQDQDEIQGDPPCTSNKKGFSQVEEKKQITYVEKQIKWVNTHRLLHKKQAYIGIKTGVTTTAGACLASFITMKARSFVLIVLNSKKLCLRFTDTELLRSWLVKKENLTQSVTNVDYCIQTNLTQ